MSEQLGFLPENGGSNPTSPLQLFFRPIKDSTINSVVVENHYAHRAVPTSWSFGAYFEDRLVGVISFGKPASRPLSIGVCGPELEPRVYELNRLWMSDECPKNSESRFIGWALKKIKAWKPIIVSFADTGVGHKGTIYAASNWIYTGLTKEQWDKTVDGKHPRWGTKEKNAIKVKRTRKHRFVYFTDPSDREKLRYPEKKWTGDNGLY